MKFKTLYADPPWQEIGGGKICRGAQRHYPVMSEFAIRSLHINGRSVKDYMEDNSHCYLWVTNNYIADGLGVLAAWGFQYKTMITWAKDRFGLGQYFRGQTEQCLFGVRGNLPYKLRPDGSRAQGRTLINAPRREHSTKPEEMRQMIELVSYAPYLELFARREYPNWTTWGNEVPDEMSKM
jgi:N6-adenosine-specific RNA methylase IME4